MENRCRLIYIRVLNYWGLLVYSLHMKNCSNKLTRSRCLFWGGFDGKPESGNPQAFKFIQYCQCFYWRIFSIMCTQALNELNKEAEKAERSIPSSGSGLRLVNR